MPYIICINIIFNILMRHNYDVVRMPQIGFLDISNVKSNSWGIHRGILGKLNFLDIS